ncbi:MAG: hypothetical protein M3362_00510 [Acidobacteriota bacterium]|nr:hypothetical protein [Acidobacteriota bacterium]
MKLFFSAVTKHWRETSKWLMYTLLGGLIPVWGGIVTFRLLSINYNFGTFTSNGEFALYSAAMLAPACYLIAKDYKDTVFVYRSVFIFICVFCLLFSAILFSLVTAVNGIGKEKLPIKFDADFLRTSTLYLFIVSIIIAYIATAVDSYRILPEDIRDMRQDAINKLGDDFDKLGGKNESK